MLIYPITCATVIKLIFVRGCNYQLPWHTPSLLVCTLPQHPAPNRRKHSSAALKSGTKMAVNKVPLCSPLWSESCFTFLLIQGKQTKSIPKPHCYQALAVQASKYQEAKKRKRPQKVTRQHVEVEQPRERARPEHLSLTGMDKHVTWNVQARMPTKRPAGQHPQMASHLHRFSLIPLPPVSWQMSCNLSPESQEWGSSSFPTLPKQLLTSLARILQLLCMSTGALSTKLFSFSNAVLGQC